jgi:hypothetical protein
MGMRSVFKYLGLFRVATALVQDAMKWLDRARDDDSPGGEDITADEYLDLIPIIENAILQGLGLAVKVKIDEDK